MSLSVGVVVLMFLGFFILYRRRRQRKDVRKKREKKIHVREENVVVNPAELPESCQVIKNMNWRRARGIWDQSYRDEFTSGEY